MAADWFDELKSASGRVDTPDGTGTGYLVGDKQVMTCNHVVRGIEECKEGCSDLTVTFGDEPYHVIALRKDDASDSAILQLDRQPNGLKPLRFARVCTRQAVWDGYGFPGTAGGIALPLQGTVMDVKSQDKKRRPSLLLFSHQIATKPDMHGFSGSPVVVNGYVIGHLKRIIGDDEDPLKPAFGYVFASPSEEILKFLKIDPDVEQVEVEQAWPLRIPSIPDDAFHALISSNSANRSFAKRLLRELEAKGFKVAADWTSGDDSLSRSKTAVVVLSREYLASALSRKEADAILAQRVSAGLRIIPVCVDDAEVPRQWMPALKYDFSAGAKPEGPMLEQVLYAVAGQRPPVRSVAAMATVPISTADPDKAVALINAGLAELALTYLPAADKDLRVRQVRALALAKNRQVDEAVHLLEQLKVEGHLDSETGGLLAGRYRQRWEETGDPLLFNAGLQMYLSAWESSDPPDPYPGINAASMLIWDGEVAQAQVMARKIIDRVDTNTNDFWRLATIAEAFVLVGETENALRFYRKMLAAGPERYENIASARRTLRRNLAKLQQPPERFEKLLALPIVGAFVGHDVDAADRAVRRFPREWEDGVRQMIADALRELRVMFGVTSAGAGSDIIFLEEMKVRNSFVRVILPCERGRFMRDFLDKEWRRRFEQAMDHPRAEVVELDEGDPEDLWGNLRPKLWHYADATARQLDDKPALIAVWDGEPGFISETVAEWRRKRASVKHLALTPQRFEAKAAEAR